MKNKNLEGANHKGQIARLNRIEGQVKAVKNMIDSQDYCIDILTQIKSIRSALKGLELNILEGHANHCLLNAVKSESKKEIETKINEIMELIRKSTKS